MTAPSRTTKVKKRVKPAKATKAWGISHSGRLCNHSFSGAPITFRTKSLARLHCIFSHGMKPVRVLITVVPS